ncbi:hypothetical protein [Rubrivivax gelatinosus]|uniref:Uncharacterized protein n=1 Tax=Rubrivivax gelatinosus TaxID=28068 RepID=A0ABS1DQP6_RUBGE|nr:hypothetical protein [Rubrivivax gelatinosus]MBK1711270.1 hypothetical protein [Rubrivivax gelatinosus]
MPTDLSILLPELRQVLAAFPGGATQATAAVQRALEGVAVGRALRRFIEAATQAAPALLAELDQHGDPKPAEKDLDELIKHTLLFCKSPEVATRAAAHDGWIAGYQAAAVKAAAKSDNTQEAQDGI